MSSASSGPGPALFDTFLDRLVHRPPARALARALAWTPVHPNHVTLASFVPAALAAASFSSGTAAGAVWGLGLFYAWAVLDHADGELARLTGRASDFGRRLDDACDAAASAVMLGGIFAGAWRLAGPEETGWAATLFAAGLFANVASGALVLAEKRRARRRAAAEAPPPGWARRQKLLDHLTGREPFYALLALLPSAFGAGAAGGRAVLGILIAGCHAVAAGSLAFWWAMRRSKRSGGVPC